MLGDTLAPALLKVIDRLKYNVKAFEKYVKINADVIAESLKWVTVLGVLAITVPPLLLVVTGLTNQFLLLTKAIAKSAIALALNPITYLVGALYVLRATLMQDFWRKAWENQIKPFFHDFGKMSVETIGQIMWQFSLIPRVLENIFTKGTAVSAIKYFIKALQQIGLVVIGVNAALHLDFDEVKRTKDEFTALNEEMRDLLFGEGLGPGNKSLTLAAGLEWDTTAKEDYQRYIADLKTVGKEIFWTGKEMGVEFGAMMSKAVEEDIGHITRLMTGLAENLPAPFLAAIEKITKAFDELKNIYKIFIAKPPVLPGVQLPKYKPPEELTAAYKKLIADYEELITFIGADQIKQPSIWAQRWEMGIRTVILNLENWQDAFTNAFTSIKDGWADTINSLLNGTITFKNAMTDMFDAVRLSFNKFVADVLASDLWYAFFGGGKPLPFGTASFFFGGKVLKSQHPFTTVSDLLGLGAGTSNFGQTDYNIDPIRDLRNLFNQKPAPGGDATVNIINKTTQDVTAKTANTSFNGKQWVVDVVLEEMRTNRGFADQIRRG